MSLLISLENCSLISHENYINNIYNQCPDGTNDSKHVHYKIKSDLFDLNAPYREKTDDGTQTEKRQQKIIKKTTNNVAGEHPDEYALVYICLILSYPLIIRVQMLFI